MKDHILQSINNIKYQNWQQQLSQAQFGFLQTPVLLLIFQANLTKTQ